MVAPGRAGWRVALEHRPPPSSGAARRRGEARCELELDGPRLLRRFGRVGAPLGERVQAYSDPEAARRAFDRQLTRLVDRGYRPGSESETHLAALARSPEDREARRAYARWLTERGDPRGRLIDLHLGGAEAEAAAWLARHPGLLQRAPLAALGDVRWRGGFVDAVHADLGATSGRDMVGLATALRRLLSHPSGLLVRRVTLARLSLGRGPCPVLAALEGSAARTLTELRIGYARNPRRDRGVEVDVDAARARLHAALPALERCEIEVSGRRVPRGSEAGSGRRSGRWWRFWRR